VAARRVAARRVCARRVCVGESGGAIELGFPHDLLAGDAIRRVTRGDLKVEARR
jgi:hypothetical protein